MSIPAVSITAIVDGAGLEPGPRGGARRRGGMGAGHSLRTPTGRRKPTVGGGSTAQSAPVRPHPRRAHATAPGGRPRGVPAPELRAGSAWPTAPASAGPVSVGPAAPRPARLSQVAVEHHPVSDVRVGLRGLASPDSIRPAPAAGLRLTDRGIALVLGVFAVLMVLAGAAVVTTFWQVTGPGSPYGR